MSISSKGLVNPIQTDFDFLAICSVVQQNLPYLQELHFTGYEFAFNVAKAIGESLEHSKHISKLSLTSCLLTLESCKQLTNKLQHCKSLEYLDFSNNSFTDLYASALNPLFSCGLKILVLDKNEFRTTFAGELAGSQTLMQFSINDNPLSYKAVLKLLESVTENKVLSSLSLLGVQFKGAAPIKENSSGLLDAQEGLILKLAYVLRNSFLSHIAVDITPLYELQLKELENTLIKHNRHLCSIDSRLIDWNNLPAESPLINIHLALKANKWLNSNVSGPVPADIKEIVRIKENYSLQTEESKAKSSKSSVINFTETSEDNYSVHSSPQFAGKEKRPKKAQKPENSQIFEFFEKILQKFNELDGRVMKKIDILENKLKDLEAKENLKTQEIKDLNKGLESFNTRLGLIECKLKPQGVVESSIKTLESLKFSLNPPPHTTKVATIENSVKNLFSKIRNIEEKTKEPVEKILINKFANFEDRLNQIERISANRTDSGKKGKKMKESKDRGSSVFTPHSSGFEYSALSSGHNGFKPPVEYESVLMSALMERANFNLKNSPERPMSAMSMHNSYTRVPSSDLQESLRKRGLRLK